MTVDEEKTLRHMLHHDAVLIGSEFGGVIAAYPSGNRRRKPICWLESDSVKRMISLGWLSKDKGQVKVSCKTHAELSGEKVDRDYASQHRDMQEQDIYVGGSIRRARHNHGLSVLQKLARRRGHNGKLFLSAAQVEAGRHFARDYAVGGLGFAATQNYETSGADTSDRHSQMEDMIISRMDRRKRVGEAIACLGPGLDRVVIAVCCEDWSLDAVERSENWVKNSGKTILIMGLDRLAQFYGTEPGVKARR